MLVYSYCTYHIYLSKLQCTYMYMTLKLEFLTNYHEQRKKFSNKLLTSRINNTQLYYYGIGIPADTLMRKLIHIKSNE